MTHAQGTETPSASASSSGPDLRSAANIVDALRASADQEFSITHRLSSNARNSFALAAGFFIIAQTVAFGGFDEEALSANEKEALTRIAIVSVLFLMGALVSTLKTDATDRSGEPPVARLEDELNAAYAGSPDVTGNLGRYYIDLIRARTDANKRRLVWYYLTLGTVVMAVGMTSAEFIYALISRMN